MMTGRMQDTARRKLSPLAGPGGPSVGGLPVVGPDRRWGFSVAPPVESEQVIQALVENVLLRQQGGTQLALDFSVPELSALHKE
jgi:hypothetical protein